MSGNLNTPENDSHLEYRGCSKNEHFKKVAILTWGMSFEGFLDYNESYDDMIYIERVERRLMRPRSARLDPYVKSSTL